MAFEYFDIFFFVFFYIYVKVLCFPVVGWLFFCLHIQCVYKMDFFSQETGSDRMHEPD